MKQQISIRQHELAQFINQHTEGDGIQKTAIPSLVFLRQSEISEPSYRIFNPALCIIVQGEKEVLLAKERFTYSPTDYLVTTVDLPATGQVTEATSGIPYLALKLEFTPSQIAEVLRDTRMKISATDSSKRAMFVSHLELPLLDAVTRLANLLDSPHDIPVLAPLFIKEILYRVLQGPHGDTLEQIAIEGSRSCQIKDVIKHIMSHYDKPFRIEELAKIANISVSSLYRRFNDVTAMSPIQFQKQLRLRNARSMLLSTSLDAGDVAFRVGYESPSQFSREYSRMFGLPPIEDIKRIRNRWSKEINA
ncbi:MAG: AraC family transcriptional regulator N-terminal domain-containing protein [Sporolactobacillus sp.]